MMLSRVGDLHGYTSQFDQYDNLTNLKGLGLKIIAL